MGHISGVIFFSLLTSYREEREKTKKEKIILKAYRNSDDDINCIIRNILMKRVHQHQKKSQTVNIIGHTSCPKVSRLTYL